MNTEETKTPADWGFPWDWENTLYVQFLCDAEKFVPKQIDGVWHFIVPCDRECLMLKRKATITDWEAK